MGCSRLLETPTNTTTGKTSETLARSFGFHLRYLEREIHVSPKASMCAYAIQKLRRSLLHKVVYSRCECTSSTFFYTRCSQSTRETKPTDIPLEQRVLRLEKLKRYGRSVPEHDSQVRLAFTDRCHSAMRARADLQFEPSGPHVEI